jgi:hypothetical protein
MQTFLTILMIGFLFTASAYAEDNNRQFRAFITGIPCGEVVKSLHQQEGSDKFALMIGSFISGSNYVKNRDSKMDLKGMLLITEQFCRQNPDLPATTALVFLDKSIDKRVALEQVRE